MERKIVTGCIVSTTFLQSIKDIVKPYYFQNEVFKPVVKWCLEYLDTYHKAPESTLQLIYDSKRESLSQPDRDLIETILHDLSKQHTDTGTPFNDAYVLDQTKRYFNKRELEIRSRNIGTLLQEDKVEEAELQISTYRQVRKEVFRVDYLFSDIYKVFEKEDNSFLQMPGALGKLIGPLQRGWLLSIFAPFKRGKTWWMQDFAIKALLNRMKVVFFSLEMSEEAQKERFYRGLTVFADQNEGTSIIMPAFDCALNQRNDCSLIERTCRVGLLNGGEEEAPDYAEGKRRNYIRCDVCRKGNRETWQPAFWYHERETKHFTLMNVQANLRALKRTAGNNMVLKTYPKFSANLSQIKGYLDGLEHEENFIPDVIIVDYASILAPEDRKETGVQRADTTWKTLAGLAAERRCLVITGSQGTRGSLYKKDTDQADLAEWIGQLAHVDVMINLNQTGAEKRMGIQRIGLLAHRHKSFFEDEQVVVLQDLSHGQVHLDSERM